MVALSQTSTQVSVDWASVPDPVLDACELEGLEGALFRALIDDGYAIVANTERSRVRLQISVRKGRFRLEARSGEAKGERTLDIPSQCDATIQLELIERARETIREVLRARAPPAQTPVRKPKGKHDPPKVPQKADEHGEWRLQLGGGVVIPSSTALGGLRLEARRAGRVWVLGALLEASFANRRGVFVSEPVIAAQLLYALWRADEWTIQAGLEAGLLFHTFSRDEARGAHVDGRFGLLLEGRWRFLGLSVMPFARLRPVLQRVEGQEAFRARYWGLLAMVTFSFALGNF